MHTYTGAKSPTAARETPGETDTGHANFNDRPLMAAVARQDCDAFQVLYRRYGDRIMKYILGIVHDAALAEDLQNEVFLTVWRSANRFEGRSQPLTWLMSIARNKAISALRRRREVTGLTDDPVFDIADETERPDSAAERSADADLLRRCIAMLSPAHQAIVDLVYYQDFSVTEAAAILEVPKNTVKTRMFYARKSLSGLLDEAGLAAA